MREQNFLFGVSIAWVEIAKGALTYRRLAAALVVCAMAVVVWWFASKPVLLHTHLLTKADFRSCGAYNEEGTGVTILNPFRSRIAEGVADAFLRAASTGTCTPDTNEVLCGSMEGRRLPGTEWRLVNQWNIGNRTRLFYQLGRQQECVIVGVSLEKAGTHWTVSGYGIRY